LALKLNDYFADPARRSILLKDELGSTMLLVGGLPLLTIVFIPQRQRSITNMDQ